jgi:hypothetical protein
VVKCVLPDLQGPLDTLELLRGSEVFLDLVEDPEAVDRALERLSTAQIGLARRLARYVSEGQAGGWSHQHGFAIRGHILLRVDTTIMLSPQMYRQQVRPHDERVLGEMGGGGLHSCGKISHLAAEFMSARGCQCLDVGQPHLNDLDRLYALARERRIPRLRLSVAEAELRSGRVLDRFPTGVSLSHAADSIEDARGIMADYQAAARRRRDSAKTPKDL